MTISKHRVLMEVQEADEREERVTFAPDTDEGSDLYETFELDWDVWCRMHKPHTITVTVEPGDHLNSEDPEPNVAGLD